MSHRTLKLKIAELLIVIPSLNEVLVGSHIQKVRDPDDFSIALKLRKPGQTIFLTLSAHPSHPRVGLSKTQPRTRPQPNRVGQWVRAHLQGKRIQSVQLLHNDKLIQVMTKNGSLILSLIPGYVNLFTLDQLNHTRSMSVLNKSQDRLGQVWTPPPAPSFQIMKTHQQPEIVYQRIIQRWEKQLNHIKINIAPLTGAITSQTEQLLELLEKGAQVLESVDQSKDEHIACKTLIQTTKDRLERLQKHLWNDLNKYQNAERLKQFGEALKAEAQQLGRGYTEIDVTDWYSSNLEKISIKLDPKLNGIENAQKYFQKHRKALRGIQLTEERILLVEEQLDTLTAFANRYAEGPYEDLRDALRDLGVFRTSQQAIKRSKKMKRLPYFLFKSAAAETIWVGRGGQDNHQLSFRIAKGGDYWVHTRNVAGAHVIIPVSQRDQEPHPETIQDAVALAVHYSPLRGENGVEVYYTQRKFIRPVPKGPPGKVMVASSKTLTSMDIHERINRLFQQRPSPT